MEPISSELPLEHISRALAARDTRGFVKLVADKNTRKILGAHILASEAGEMIAELALAVQFGLTIENLTSAFHPYLTLSEGIKLAAQTLRWHFGWSTNEEVEGWEHSKWGVRRVGFPWGLWILWPSGVERKGPHHPSIPWHHGGAG